MKVFQFHDNGYDKILVSFGFDACDPTELDELRAFLEVAARLTRSGSQLEARIVGCAQMISPMIMHAREEAARPKGGPEPGPTDSKGKGET